MKKRNLVVPAALVLLGGVIAGAQKKLQSKPEANPATEEDRAEARELDIQAKAKELIRRINSADYQACYDALSHTLMSSMTMDQMKETFDSVLQALGEFVEFADIQVYDQEDSPEGYSRCDVFAVYQNGMAIYSIMFDHHGRVEALNIK